MADYIKREDAIETLMQMCWHDGDGYPVEDADEKRQYAEDWVNAISSADVVEVRHGKWVDKTMSVPNGHGQTYGKYGCSLCKGKVRYKTAFCPNCGADMRGE